jgi:hypothetical protein
MFVPFIDGPDVVLRVDADRMRERKAVVVASDLAGEIALGVVLEDACLVGAVINVDIALRIGGNSHVLAGVDAGGVLEEVRNRLVRNRGNVLNGRPALRRERSQNRHHGDERGQRDDELETAPHCSLRNNARLGRFRECNCGNLYDSPLTFKAIRPGLPPANGREESAENAV